ncbi:hypothetical protein [Sporisorium scitamineum]|uniref:Uncharacterized protein n=1 Tax=Sporisorium scitamineum TaxID=49012 RepID=A0A0F7RVP7_9BASI|nr:hypothetical protein [Sporisorium scitamineum]
MQTAARHRPHWPSPAAVFENMLSFGRHLPSFKSAASFELRKRVWRCLISTFVVFKVALGLLTAVESQA